MAAPNTNRNEAGMTSFIPSDGNVRLVGSPTVQYTLILAVLGGLCSGVWFFATQVATNASAAERQIRFEAAMLARLETDEKRFETRSAAIDAIENKLARIDAQLGFILAAVSMGPSVSHSPTPAPAPDRKGTR